MSRCIDDASRYVSAPSRAAPAHTRVTDTVRFCKRAPRSGYDVSPALRTRRRRAAAELTIRLPTFSSRLNTQLVHGKFAYKLGLYLVSFGQIGFRPRTFN